MSTDQKIDLRLHLPQDEFDYSMLAAAARECGMTIEQFGVAAVQMAVAAVLMPCVVNKSPPVKRARKDKRCTTPPKKRRSPAAN